MEGKETFIKRLVVYAVTLVLATVPLLAAIEIYFGTTASYFGDAALTLAYFYLLYYCYKKYIHFLPIPKE